MCFVFKSAVVFLCKERLRQKKKSVIGSSSKSSAAEVEIIRYQVLVPVTEVQVRVLFVDIKFVFVFAGASEHSEGRRLTLPVGADTSEVPASEKRGEGLPSL